MSFPKQLYHSFFLPEVQEGSVASHPCQHLILAGIFSNSSHSNKNSMLSHGGFNLHLLITDGAEHSCLL